MVKVITKDVLNKIGEPYIKSFKSSNKSKAGLGLGIFIRNNIARKKSMLQFFVKIQKIRSGAEVNYQVGEIKNLLEL